MHSSFTIIVILILSLFSLSSFATKNPTLDEVFQFLDLHYPTTPLLDGLGNCTFPITSSVSSPLLQNYSSILITIIIIIKKNVLLWFNFIIIKDMGMCMLHTFWPSESLRAFREILKIDANNSMAYWGVYQCVFYY